MTKATIHGSEQPIVKIFSSDYSFTIPNYQRPYSWSVDQAGQLLDDLAFFAFQEYEYDDLKPYFLGSVVLIKDENNPSAQVVDGQQRLTTLTLLLAVLRELLPSLKSYITEVIYEKGNPVKGTKDRFRLQLRDRDQDFFNKYVQQEGGLAKIPEEASLPDSQANIRRNANHLKGMLAKYTSEQLELLVKYAVQKTYLVVVSSSDEESAYRIFSVLNDRGLQLSHSDILKAEIIGAISRSEQDIYTKKWEDIEQELGIEKFKELFVHIRMISRKVKARDSILKEIRENLKPKDHPKEFIDQILIPYGNAFQDVKDKMFESVSEENNKVINQYLIWLNRFDNDDWIPPAISFLTKWGQKDTAKVAEFLKGLERLAFGLYVMGIGINGRIERYGKVLSGIENEKEIISADFGLTLTKEECDQIVNILSGDIYGQKFDNYLLLRLDSFLSHGEATYNYPIISIEHVLPQTPEKDSQWASNFDDMARKELTHCLGNLVLLSRRKNSASQNYDFDIKKTRYFMKDGVSPFALTTDVINRPSWTPDVIRDRRNQLVGNCKTIWML